MFIVAIKVKVAWWKITSSSSHPKLVRAVLAKLTLRGNSIVFSDERNLRTLARKVGKAPGALIYPRQKR